MVDQDVLEIEQYESTSGTVVVGSHHIKLELRERVDLPTILLVADSFQACKVGLDPKLRSLRPDVVFEILRKIRAKRVIFKAFEARDKHRAYLPTPVALLLRHRESFVNSVARVDDIPRIDRKTRSLPGL
jgi:hypothetical protein